MNSSNSNYKILMYFFMVLCLTTCAKIGSDLQLDGVTNVIQIAQVETIPQNYSEDTLVPVINNGWHDVKLIGAWVTTNDNKQIDVLNDITIVDVSDCIYLNAGLECIIKFKSSFLDSYIINLNFSDKDGNKYIARQMIDFSEQLPLINGIKYNPSNIHIVKSFGQRSVAIIPIKLQQSFIQLIVHSNNQNFTPVFKCSNGFNLDSQCSLIVNISNFNSDQTSGIISLANNSGQSIAELSIRASNQSLANLITSASNVIINPANGLVTKNVTILNTGTSVASGIIITSPDNNISFSGTNNCTSLSPNVSCSFIVSATSEVNNQSYVQINYNNSQNTSTLKFNLIYIGTGGTTYGLQLLSYGNLMFSPTVPSNMQSLVAVQVTNNSKSREDNIHFSGLITDFSFLNYQDTPCKTDGTQSLASGESCNLVISYQPNNSQIGNLTLSGYITRNGAIIYISSLNIPYSSATPTSNLFITSGGYGAMFTNSSPSSQAWTTIISKPNTQNAWSIVNNNESLVLIKHDTNHSVMSSTRGLFWKDNSSINFASSSTLATSIIFANNKYYASGYDSGNLSYIYSSNNLQSWSQEYNTSSLAHPDGEIQHLYWFNNSVLAPTWQHIDLAKDDTTLVYNTSGAWYASAAIGATLYSWTLPVLLYDNNKYYLFGYYGYYAGAAPSNLQIFSEYYSNIDDTSNTTSAVYYDGKYISGTDLGQIYVNNDVTSDQSWSNKFNVSSGCNLATNGAIIGLTKFKNKYWAMSANLCSISSSDTNSWTASIINSPISGTSANSLYNDGNYLWLANSNDLLMSDNGNEWVQPAINNITYNGSFYIAVGSGGTIFTSIDLSTWISRVSNTSNNLNFVKCVNAEKCFAGGESGTLLASINGNTWSNVTLATNKNLNGIACGYNNCIIVGDNGTLLSSSDLINWNQIPASAFPPISTNINAIDYISYSAMNNGISYVIVGDNGLLKYAKGNGLSTSSWYSPTSTVPSSNNLNAIFCVDQTNSNYSYQCLIAGDKSSLYEWNKDQTWSVQNPGFTADNYHNYYSITKMNNSLVAVGFDSSAGKGWGFISSSSDGTSWQSSSSSSLPSLKTIIVK